MIKKAKKIDDLLAIIKEIESRFSRYVPIMNYYLLYEKDNKNYVFSDFMGMPKLDFSNVEKDGYKGDTIVFEFSFDETDEIKKEEKHPELFGDKLSSFYEWQNVEYGKDIIKYDLYEISQAYAVEPKVNHTNMCFRLTGCNLIEVYPWGYFIQTNNIFSVVAIATPAEEKSDLLEDIIGSWYGQDEFVWPLAARNISLLECYWQKDNETENLDELLYSTEVEDIDKNDYSHLDI